MGILKKCGRGVCVLMAALLALLGPVSAAEALTEEAQAKEAVETFLRSYETVAMLDQGADLTAGTVSGAALAWEPAGQTFTISGRTVTLESLRENIRYLAQKAAYYAGMRRLQNISREDLGLTYVYQSLRLEGNTGRAVVSETAEFRYTDSVRRSVFETVWRVTLVKAGGRWAVADAADGSGFDGAHKGKGPLDVPALLAEFAEGLAREDCTVSYPLPERVDPAGKIFYHGGDAAAYAYTYARPDAGRDRERFYSGLFKAYAGNGGDCMNFASQCMWAGFGGSETPEDIDGHTAPMDTEGPSAWYGRTAAEGTRDTEIYSWISCGSFRSYLMDKEAGTNLSEEPGMYATVLDLGYGGVSGVLPEELTGAAAHVSGSGGPYSHAVILTAATGLTRGEIWFCSHTADITHIKLGDCYTGPLKIYIPRYMRAGGASGAVRPERMAPVSVGDVRTLGFSAEEGAYRSLTLSVTAPGGTEPERQVREDGTLCSAAFEFTQEGLYRVECTAEPFTPGPPGRAVFYIRCMAPEEGTPGTEAHEPGAPEPEAEEGMQEENGEEKEEEARRIRQSLFG